MRNSRVVDHRHDGNIDIYPQNVDVDDIQESYASYQIPRRNGSCGKSKEKTVEWKRNSTENQEVNGRTEPLNLLTAFMMINGTNSNESTWTEPSLQSLQSFIAAVLDGWNVSNTMKHYNSIHGRRGEKITRGVETPGI